MPTLGIDVSENNGKYLDWKAIADYGVKFAIVRSTYGKTGEDELFLYNVNAAHENGIKCGSYHYSYALNGDAALIEAEHCREYIAKCGVLLELPVFFDMEDADGYKERHGFWFNKSNITGICKVFLDNIQLRTGVYASESWFNNYIDWRSLNCPVWNAAWLPNGSYKPENHTDYDGIGGYLWQFTDSLNINGQYLDGDYMYADL